METEVTGSVVGTLFGLAGFAVLAAADAGGEVELLVETVAAPVPCPACGAVAEPKDRRAVWVRDLPIGERPVVVCWHKGSSILTGQSAASPGCAPLFAGAVEAYPASGVLPVAVAAADAFDLLD